MHRLGTIAQRTVATAALAALMPWMAALPAQAGCVRHLVNRSNLTLVASRDGGPAVVIPPHRSQAIRYRHSGHIDLSLTCGHPDESAPVHRASYDTVAEIDRCYVQFGSRFFENELGRGFFGTRNTAPLTLNNPNQGDVIVGPQADALCPVDARTVLRSRY